MSKVTKNRIIIVCLLAAAIVVLYLLGEIELLLSWKGITLLLAGVVAFVSQGVLVGSREPVSESSEHDQIRELTKEELEAVTDFLALTNRPCINLKAYRKPTGVYDSKFGGTPYLPSGFEYPRNKCKGGLGDPLKLLCQLNFATLPPLPDFPQNGILQFYVAPNKDDYFGVEMPETVFGVDFDHPTRQNAWRVVYHREIVKDEWALQSPPKINLASTNSDEEFNPPSFPFDGEFALEAELGVMPINPVDYGWDDFMKTTLGPSAIGRQLTEKYKPYELEEAFAEVLSATGHRVGGYPFFTQEDPRLRDNKKHSVLLLQIDSDEEICWGDAGVANFFITPDDLARCDFSRVLYNWDCM